MGEINSKANIYPLPCWNDVVRRYNRAARTRAQPKTGPNQKESCDKQFLLFLTPRYRYPVLQWPLPAPATPLTRPDGLSVTQISFHSTRWLWECWRRYLWTRSARRSTSPLPAANPRRIDSAAICQRRKSLSPQLSY